ncbi:hypothetical protein ES703_78441 [subsurface metagenome]
MTGGQDTKLLFEVTDVNRCPAFADGETKAVRDGLSKRKKV